MAYVTPVTDLGQSETNTRRLECAWVSQEYQCKSPDLQVQAGSQEAFEGKRFSVAVGAISVDSADNEGTFSLAQEHKRLVCPVREIDKED